MELTRYLSKQVKDHKTKKAFGEAQIVLDAREFSWLQRWLTIKEGFPGQKSDYVLFTSGQGPCHKLGTYLQQAWDEMGHTGRVSFTLIRTAVASYVSHSPYSFNSG